MHTRSFVLGSLFVTASLAASTQTAAAQQCDPAKLMVVLDKSSSMQTGTINGDSKWSIAVGALDTVVTEFETSIEMGLTVFPVPDECSPGTMVVEPALDTRNAIMSELSETPPAAGNWTPMAQTLEATAVEPSLVNTAQPKFAVLVTDGWQWCSPYDPSTRFDPVDAIGSLNGAGVTTYVVGFGGAVDALALNMMAVEAGTAIPGCDPSGDTPTSPNPCYLQADDPSELQQVLTDIAVTVSAEVCDGLDNDCDGEIDEDLYRDCATDCGLGTETCDLGVWTGCDAPPVEDEVCDGFDNDCNGEIDPGCDCAAGDSRSCGGDETTGACTPGTQTCSADGMWGDCEGAVGPETESCDGLDNDCDGELDEMDDDVGNLCGPGFMCVEGGCEELDPVVPIGDDDEPEPMNPADDDGTAVANCACFVGDGSDPGQFAGGGLLVLLCAMVLGSRRRRRRG
jgi:hypothetical protein